MTDFLTIMEVGPRDGLQNQAKILPAKIRRQYIQLLLNAGVRRFEAGSLVRKDFVPQMANSPEVIKNLGLDGAEAYFLVPNEKGLERALKHDMKHIAVFTAVTDGFNLKNIGMTMDASLEMYEKLIPKAISHGLKVRGYLSMVWGCPYDGKPKLRDILRMTEALLQGGCTQVSLGDTIGVATPNEVKSILKKILKEFPRDKIALHLHDTRGMAIANAFVGLDMGIRTLDTSSGGLGGCPFAPGASGNVGTEDILYMAAGMGLETGIQFEALVKASEYIYKQLGLSARASKTLDAYRAKKWK